jgi:hypothetical protein
MTRIVVIIVLALVAGSAMAVALHAQTASAPDNVPRMTVEELKLQMDNANLVVIDVRTSHDWEVSATKIRGSVREDPSKVASWIAKYPPDRTLVFYCA